MRGRSEIIYNINMTLLILSQLHNYLSNIMSQMTLNMSGFYKRIDGLLSERKKM